MIAYQKVDAQHIEKISLTLILLMIFDIYFFCYLTTNEKIAITHLWHAIEPQTMYLGPVVAAQQVLDPSPQTSCPRKEKGGGGGGTSATTKSSGV